MKGSKMLMLKLYSVTKISSYELKRKFRKKFSKLREKLRMK